MPVANIAIVRDDLIYSLGTISVATGSSTVTGTGVLWSDFVDGLDTLDTPKGPATVASVDATRTIITLLEPWPWAALVNSAYKLYRDSPLRTDGVDVAWRVRQLLEDVQGVDFLQTQGADIAAVTILNLQTASGQVVDVTGNTGIAQVLLDQGQQRWVRFTGVPLITVGAQLVGNNGGQNIQVEAGDVAQFRGYASGVVRSTLWRASGLPISAKFRERLTAARDYFVNSTAGNELNSGRDAANPFLTIKKAIDTIYQTLDCAGYGVNIRLADGTYGPAVFIGKPLNCPSLALLGNLTAPQNCIASVTSANAVAAQEGALVSCSGVTVQTAINGSGFLATDGGILRLGEYGPVRTGPCGNEKMLAAYGGTIEIFGNYSDTGNAVAHWHSYGQSRIDVLAVITVTIVGSPVYSTYWAGANQSEIAVANVTFVNKAAVTAQRYLSHLGALIYTGTNDKNYLPGNTPGVVQTGGSYDDLNCDLIGTITNDDAPAGRVGEFIPASVLIGAAVALTSGTARLVCSITVGAGDFEVGASIGFTGPAGTTVNLVLGSISTTAALDTAPGRAATQVPAGAAVFALTSLLFAVGPTRVTVAVPTTVNLYALGSFSGTCSAFGEIHARRKR